MMMMRRMMDDDAHSQGAASSETSSLQQGVMQQQQQQQRLSLLPNVSRRSGVVSPPKITSMDDFEFVEQVDDRKYQQEEQQQQQQKQEIPALALHSNPQQRQQQKPTLLRILFMGNALSDKHKSNVLKKFAEAFASMVQRKPFNSNDHPSSGICRMEQAMLMTFHEREHHIVFLDTFDTEPIDTYPDHGLSVIEADFTWSTTDLEEDDTTSSSSINMFQYQHSLLHAYIEYHWQKIDLVVYFFSSHATIKKNLVDQDMEFLKRLSELYHVPTWPLLVHRPYESRPSTQNTYRTASSRTPTPNHARIATPSFITEDEVDPISLKQSFSEQLIRHGITCVELTDINPERPHFMKNKKEMEQKVEEDIMTVDQFITIDKKTLADMLKRWQQKRKRHQQSHIWHDRKKKMWRMMGPQGKVLMMLFLLMGWFVYMHHSNKDNTSSSSSSNSNSSSHYHEKEEKIQLHPMWQNVNQDTLRHLFMIQPLSQKEEYKFSVILDQSDQKREYPMVWYPETKHYLVDVPSPCLLHAHHDFIASVYQYPLSYQHSPFQDNDDLLLLSDEDSSPAMLIDRVLLTVEACDQMMKIQSTFAPNALCTINDDKMLSTVVIHHPQNVKEAVYMMMTSIKALCTFIIQGIYQQLLTL